MTRGQRGREKARLMIVMAVIAIAGTAFLIVSAPRFMGGDPMEGSPWRYAHVLVAGVGIIVGLLWMIRIYRADPEPDQHAWRYRAKR